jgi:chemotaxis protein methyltransferase CheR
MNAAARTAGGTARGAAARAASMVPDGEFLMTEADFAQIAGILEGHAGIMLPPAKATMAYSRLAKRLRTLRLANFAEYCALLEGPEGKGEKQKLIQALTTNVTNFFREPHHFEHLKRAILPALIERAKKGGKVRIWSAASSSGQEPYSIALTLLSVMPEAAQHDIKILATDIDASILAIGAAGVYEAEVLGPVPAELKSRWFKPVDDEPGSFRATETLRSLITFRELNLIGEWPMRGPFDAIFCRNVVIYFSAETQAQLWARFAPLLEPGAALYVGHSERITGPAEKLLSGDGVTIYRKLGARP